MLLQNARSNSMGNKMLSIEVAYAGLNDQIIMTINMPEGSTLEDAIHASQILKKFPEIDLALNKVGVFGEIFPLSRKLQLGDRVEIYRPLLIDPKQKRFEKVKMQRKKRR